jgi:hypothetical protein
MVKKCTFCISYKQYDCAKFAKRGLPLEYICILILFPLDEIGFLKSYYGWSFTVHSRDFMEQPSQCFICAIGDLFYMISKDDFHNQCSHTWLC